MKKFNVYTFDNERVAGSENTDARKPFNHVSLDTSVLVTDSLVGQQQFANCYCDVYDIDCI